MLKLDYVILTTPLPQKKNLWGARSFYISVWLVVVTWVCMCIYMCVCIYATKKEEKNVFTQQALMESL